MGELLAAGALLALAYLWVLSQPEPAQPRRLQLSESWADPFDPGERPIQNHDGGDERPDPGPDWCMCPRGHVAFLRRSDGAIYCDTEGRVYYEDFARTYDLAA